MEKCYLLEFFWRKKNEFWICDKVNMVNLYYDLNVNSKNIWGKFLWVRIVRKLVLIFSEVFVLFYIV